MAYSHDGEGLHRSTDPADGEALRLRPPLPRRRPDGLRLLRPARPQGALHRRGHRPGRLDRPRQRRRRPSSRRAAPSSATTPPLATYFVTVCAGPYASVRAEHDGIPLGLHARRRSSRTCASRPSTCSTTTRGLLRRLPPAVRHPLPVRRVPPGVRARVQRRGDGEPRLRDLPRHDDLPRRGDTRPGALRAATPSRTRWRTCGSATSSR